MKRSLLLLGIITSSLLLTGCFHDTTTEIVNSNPTELLETDPLEKNFEQDMEFAQGKQNSDGFALGNTSVQSEKVEVTSTQVDTTNTKKVTHPTLPISFLVPSHVDVKFQEVDLDTYDKHIDIRISEKGTSNMATFVVQTGVQPQTLLPQMVSEKTIGKYTGQYILPHDVRPQNITLEKFMLNTEHFGIHVAGTHDLLGIIMNSLEISNA